MNPFVHRARVDDFARLLDGALPAGALPAGALRGGALPSGAPVLVARLRATGAALSATTGPSPDFRASLRTRLVAVASVQAATSATAAATPVRARGASGRRAAPAAVPWVSARRGAGVAAGAMASVVAVTGVAVASSQSLPGDPLYGTKRAAEALQLRTADGAVEKGTRHLGLASTRLREVRGLVLGRDALSSSALSSSALSSSALATSVLSAGVAGAVPAAASTPPAPGAALSPAVAERVRRTLADMDASTRTGTDLLTGAYRDSRSAAPLQALSRFATRQSEGLAQLLPTLPPAAQERARVSLALLTGVATETDELLGLGTCGAGCEPGTGAPSPGGTPSTTAPTAPDEVSGTPPCDCDPVPGTDGLPTVSMSPEPLTAQMPTMQEPDQPAPAPEPEPDPSGSPQPEPETSGSPTPSSSPDSPLLPSPLPPLPVVPVPGLLAPDGAGAPPSPLLEPPLTVDARQLLS